MTLSSKTIQYQNGDQIHHGYFVRDQNIVSPRPGIIVIHEWWGLNEYIKMRADMLAEQGYCFGGTMALHMARMGMPLAAAVSFHGALGSFHTPEPGQVKASILVCHGAEDAMVSMDDVASFKQEMREANADYEVLIHAGAKHGFTSKEADQNASLYGIPLGYDADADAQSWAAMLSLFKKTLIE